MYSRIELAHFKCFEKLVLPLGALTLLSGSNAAGKSSVLQALVLLHQTMREHEWSKRLLLNGGILQLGTVLDIVDKVYGRRSFELGLVRDATTARWSFGGDRDEMSMAIDSFTLDDIEHPDLAAMRHLVPHDCYEQAVSLATHLLNLTYITAERVGPQQLYSLDDAQSSRVVGPRGEHTISVLYRGRDEQASAALCLPDAAPTRFHQIGARMQQFFPGCGLEVQRVPRANSLTLGLRTANDTDFHRPIHVGFGLTQVLPIVVAALSAAPGDLVLIENPEVHLHPAGQALMGLFLAEVAASGVQVVVETHSDHVLNGIRRAVRHGKLNAADTVLHFFQPRTRNQSQVVSPSMDRTGNIDVWPNGFFDQFDKDMNHFAGWGD